MHEASIAESLVDLVTAELPSTGTARVAAVRVRVGALSGVVPAALRSAFGPACSGTPLAGARLDLDAVGVTVWCDACAAARPLPGVAPLRCPACGGRTPRVLAGRELEVVSVEVHDLVEPAH